MSSNFKDKFLVASSLAGDERAFAELYEKYVDNIFRYIFFRVRGMETAQDLTSDVFLKVWQYIGKPGREIENFRSLLYRIARNLVIDHYRSQGREMLVLEDEQWSKFVDERVNLEEDIIIKDDIRLIMDTLKKLPDEQKDLLAMKFLDDLSIA